MLLKEAKRLLNKADWDHINTESKKPISTLSEEDIFDWIQIFEEDRIMLDGCNHATVKR